MERAELLRGLIEGRLAPAEAEAQLAAFPWDCDEPLVRLTPEAVAAILKRYMAGALDAADVTAWADALEVRDDVGFEADWEDEGPDVIFQLANPLLEGELTPDQAAGLLERLPVRPE
jgi:hypothetical protein